MSLAEKNGCYLVTQEKTLRNLAELIINGKLLSFEDLVADLYSGEQLTKKEIEDGLHSLDYFKEYLRSDQKKKITDLI